MTNSCGFNDYEHAPLNQAHLFERKAEYCLRQEKYDEAIAYHLKAENLLSNLLKQAYTEKSNSHIIDSLDSQQKHHKKQELIITLKQKQKSFLPNENVRKLSQEGFQNISTYSTISLESYDSVDYTSGYNNDQLVKRDEVIKKMGLLIRQQQNEIIALSTKLRKNDKEKYAMNEKIIELENLLKIDNEENSD